MFICSGANYLKIFIGEILNTYNQKHVPCFYKRQNSVKKLLKTNYNI